MKGFSLHIIRAAALCLFLGSGGCRSGRSDDAAGGPTVMLGLTAEVLGSARTDGSDASADIEKMHSLRIVVLRPDGSVEHNLFVDFGPASQSEYARFLAVRKNEKKSIFLIANESGVSPDLHTALDTMSLINI